ncbi:hypothetical protein CMV_019531 [Castanea mollissima]|uniref:Uncharacterized protein n=1 Tax=Castanea mollissima TaxID=60419 RepID=A0A8J4VNK8_9ROSI|nr:hypothetical protein CMV_019531 [Castanea mollissima]
MHQPVHLLSLDYRPQSFVYILVFHSIPKGHPSNMQITLQKKNSDRSRLPATAKNFIAKTSLRENGPQFG